MTTPDLRLTQLAQYAAESGYVQLGKDGFPVIHKKKSLKELLRGMKKVDVDSVWLDKVKDLADQIKLSPVFRRAAAKQQMQRGWERLGGPRSSIGLPVTGQIEIHEIGPPDAPTEYTADFRGGTLHLTDNGGTVTSYERTLGHVMLVGVECQMRQEKADEVYGVVAAIGPSNQATVTRRFPDSGTLTLGPDGMRISNLGLMLVDGSVVQDYIIIATLVENDSGDVDVIAKNIADKIAGTAAAVIGGLTGAPAEAVGESESFKQNLATGLGWVFGSILGMGDDPYNAESFPLSWTTLKQGNPPLQPPVTRNDDPRTIAEWTHKLVLSGMDDGGDRGQYALYFKVWTTLEISTETASTRP